MFIKSIRWRMQLWLAFLLACILSGFGITAYQLQRTNRLSLIDEELERRVAALSGDVIGPAMLAPPLEPGGFGSGRASDGGKGGPGGHRLGPRGGPPPGGDPGRDGLGPPQGPAPGKARGRLPGPPMDEPGFGPFRESPEFRPGIRQIQIAEATQRLFPETETNGFYYAVWTRDGTLLKRSTNAPAELAFPQWAAVDTRIRTWMRGNYREAFHFTEMHDCVLVGRPIFADLAAIRRFAWLLVAAGAAVLLLGLGGGWLLARHAFHPIEQISVTADRISAGNLSERIDVDETDSELGRLADVLNSMFFRLEAAFSQQKQFTADAAHELRTPLAVMISEAQTTLARERDAAGYRETVEACLNTAQQMRRLAESLLELARFDAGQQQLQREPVDLAAQTSSCVEFVRPLADRHGIRVFCNLSPAPALGDAVRLSQVITNLLNNAIQHNKDQGEVPIDTRTEGAKAVLSVSDTGPGIAAEDLPHIFVRFYRADKSRSGTAGRTGLGLAISKAIVGAHGGTIEALSPAGGGTTFTVRLPLQSQPG